MTQTQLAKGNCDKSRISRIESNKFIPDHETLLLIKSNLHIDDVPLTEQEVDNFQKELEEWYKLIKNKQFDEVKELQPILKFKVSKSLEKKLVIYYNLFEARLLLHEQKLSEALSLLKSMDGERSNFTEHQKYFYNYFYGIYHGTIGDDKCALKSFLLAEKAGKSSNFIESSLYYSISNAFTRMDYAPIAIAYGTLSLEKARVNNEMRNILLSESILALNYGKIGFFELAIERFNECVYRAREANNTLYLGIFYHNLGCTFYRMKNYCDALKYFNKANTYCNYGDEYYLNNTLHIIYILIDNGNFTEAKEKIENALPLAKGNDEKFFLLQSIHHSLNLTNHLSLNFIEKITIPRLLNCRMNLKAIDYCNILIRFFNQENTSKKPYKKILQYTELAYNITTMILKGDIL